MKFTQYQTKPHPILELSIEVNDDVTTLRQDIENIEPEHMTGKYNLRTKIRSFTLLYTKQTNTNK